MGFAEDAAKLIELKNFDALESLWKDCPIIPFDVSASEADESE